MFQNQSQRFQELAASLPPSGDVQKALAHLAATGSFDRADVRRVLGEQYGSVRLDPNQQPNLSKAVDRP